MLEDLARQKGIQVDPLQWELGQTHSETEEFSTETTAEVGIPPAGRFASTLGTRQGKGKSSTQTIGAERKYNTRSLLNQLLSALEADAELDRRLAQVPGDAEEDSMLVSLLLNTRFSWGLDDLPEGDPRTDLTSAFSTVGDEALGRIDIAKNAELAEAVPDHGSSKFALVETQWEVRDSTGSLQLTDPWLVDDDDGDLLLLFQVGAFLTVPIDPSKLTAMGRQRLRPGTELWLRVFAKIEAFENGTLILLPILISSS